MNRSLMLQYDYVIAVAEERSFSRAAQRLFISQPSLSHYIKKIEDDLGVQLFDRDSVPLRTTYAGEIFLKSAYEILAIEKQLSQQMYDIANLHSGRLSVGVSPYIASYTMPYILPFFYEKFPNVIVVLQESSLDKLEQMAFKGELDLALTNTVMSEKEFICRRIYSDETVLCVPNKMDVVTLNQDSPKTGFPLVEMSQFQTVPFISMQADQILGRITRTMCASASIQPKIIMESRNFSTAFAMVEAGIGVTILPYLFVRYQNNTKNVQYYSIINNEERLDLMAVYRKSSYLSATASEFMNIVEEHLSNLD